MQYRCVVLALGLGLAACASGETAVDPVDAPKADEADARIDAAPGPIDAPGTPIDAPPGTPIDAPATPIDAPATPIDAPMTPIDAPPPTGNPDTCAQAQDITAAAMAAGGTTVTGSTVGYADDVVTPSSCTGYTSDGPDAIYAVNLTAGRLLTATVSTTGAAWDVSLELVMPCTTTPACLDGADSGFSGDPETVTYTATGAITAYVVVDGYNPGVAGGYSLNVRIQ